MSNERRKQFPFEDFEPRWQALWDEKKSFRTSGPGDADFDASKPKYFVLDMFPYPSGAGLHVGHPEGYTATDIVARYKRMSGFNVLHPMGWDAFGLPAEQYAIKTGQHPRITTEKNVDGFRGQLKRLGFAYDWDREVNTTDPNYFKWTQWIFLQLYHSYFDTETKTARPISELEAKGLSRDEIDARRLAFVSEAPVHWCPELGTVLSNEEVIDGKSEVGGFPVERRPLRQWMLRITDFAQRLIDDLDGLDWPESIKLLQRNWIGRSEGAEVSFELDGLFSSDTSSDLWTPAGQPLAPAATPIPVAVTVFTTRPDTLFGATYMVLAPEHPLVDSISAAEQKDAIEAYRKTIASKSDLERTELAKDKSGVFTGGYAINPVNGARIPVWIADYVLMTYGTGAIMAVPGHDERDFEFAQKFDLPVVQVVEPPAGKDWQGFTDDGTAVNSGFLDGLTTPEAKRKMIDWLEEKKLGKGKVNFKLRDWLFSRQRYWGEPFPIYWENGKHQAVPFSDLPVLPPDLADFKPTGTPEPPLSKATDWVRYSETASRELNTMPQWAGSCWYYLRYCDPNNSERFISKEADEYWMGSAGKPGGVDLYVGGTEHAVLHLLYARFWHKVLFDLGHVCTPEPFQRLVNQGLILGEQEFFAFANPGNAVAGLVSASEVADIQEHAVNFTTELCGHDVYDTTAASGLRGVNKHTGQPLVAARLLNPSVEKKGEFFYLAGTNVQLEARTFKMSKARGNVVNPDDVIREYGADSLRLYEMFMGPLEQVKPWSMKGVEGVYRFLARVWRLVFEVNQEGEWNLSPQLQDIAADKKLNKVVHETIKKVGDDIERLGFNTAISQMMVMTNALTQADVRPVASIVTLLQVLNPFAPHLTEELAARIGEAFPAYKKDGLLAHQTWPTFDESALVVDEIEVVVQVNGKLRGRVIVPKDTEKEVIEKEAMKIEKVQEFLVDVTIRKVIYVPGKLLNIVAN